MSASPGRGCPQHQVRVAAGADQRVCAQETVGGEVLAGGLELALVRLPLGGGQAPPGRVDLQERELDDIAVHGPTSNIRGAVRGPWCSPCVPVAPAHAQRAPRAAIVFWPGPQPLAKPPAIERLAQAPGLSAFGFMSAIQGSYTPEQTFLDMSAGARTTTSLYDDELPTDLRLAPGGRMSSWRAIADAGRHRSGRRRSRACLRRPCATAGGHVGYAGPRTSRNREAAVAADRSGRVERVALVRPERGRARGAARCGAIPTCWS